MLRVLKFIALGAGSLVLLVVLYFGLVILRKSVPYFLPGDVEQLASSGPYNDAELASAICGTKVDLLGAPDIVSPLTALPRARLLSWQPIYPAEGTVSVRITGQGFRRAPETVTGPCEGTITFKYRLAWEDNGRAVVLDKRFIESPKVVR